jgi:hypothetical protein
VWALKGHKALKGYEALKGRKECRAPLGRSPILLRAARRCAGSGAIHGRLPRVARPTISSTPSVVLDSRLPRLRTTFPPAGFRRPVALGALFPIRPLTLDTSVSTRTIGLTPRGNPPCATSIPARAATTTDSR